MTIAKENPTFSRRKLFTGMGAGALGLMVGKIEPNLSSCREQQAILEEAKRLYCMRPVERFKILAQQTPKERMRISWAREANLLEENRHLWGGQEAEGAEERIQRFSDGEIGEKNGQFYFFTERMVQHGEWQYGIPVRKIKFCGDHPLLARENYRVVSSDGEKEGRMKDWQNLTAEEYQTRLAMRSREGQGEWKRGWEGPSGDGTVFQQDLFYARVPEKDFESSDGSKRSDLVSASYYRVQRYGSGCPEIMKELLKEM